ncbi:polysaccharide deacetylase family protein, partial [Escherichia coli]|nr:polysaccharide deacetylase family protein [Escherichia coli]
MRMFARVITLFLFLASASVSASLLSQQGVPARYMQVTEDADIWAQVGNHVVSVGNVRAGQILAVVPTTADYYEFNFGFGTGFIDKGHLGAVQGAKRVEDSLGDLRQPLSNQNLLTWKDTPVYDAPSVGSPPFGTLANNLRYPIISKLKDRLNQTWYQIRIGNRLAWVSSLDAQEDNGIPLLTYHHILRDEENSRFRHTSTTTSVRAFSNQMTWLRDQGYTTLTMYQLEGYLRNKVNLPARSVVITFDDGLKSVNRYAYPILKQYGFHATAFIISSRIKRHPQKWDPKSLQFMSISELRQIQDVFDVQSHTHFLHRVDAARHPILLSRNYHNILFDFERSRRALSQFNPHVLYLSYPFGGYNATAVKAAN